jgi:hypothetical protein
VLRLRPRHLFRHPGWVALESCVPSRPQVIAAQIVEEATAGIEPFAAIAAEPQGVNQAPATASRARQKTMRSMCSYRSRQSGSCAAGRKRRGSRMQFLGPTTAAATDFAEPSGAHFARTCARPTCARASKARISEQRLLQVFHVAPVPRRVFAFPLLGTLVKRGSRVRIPPSAYFFFPGNQQIPRCKSRPAATPCGPNVAQTAQLSSSARACSASKASKRREMLSARPRSASRSAAR